MKHNLLSLLLLLWGAVAAFAQTTMVSLPYAMSFEESGSDSAEVAQGLWHLNHGAQASACVDHWKIGSSVKSDGKQSLYVVCQDTIDRPGYEESANLQFVWRDIQVPTGSYILSFDWMNPSGSDSAALYVGWVQYSGTTPPSKGSITSIAANSSNGTFPSSLTSNCSGALYGQGTWQNYKFTRTIQATANTTTTYRVFVAWANKGGVKKRGYGAALDNIQLVDVRCASPTSIQVVSITCDTLKVSWNGTADDYQVQFRRIGSSTWSSAGYDHSTGLNTSTGRYECMLEGLAEGSYEVRVRGIYNINGVRNYSAYTKCASDVLVYCVDNHCINYFDLTASNVVCTYGSNYNGYGSSKNTAFATVGVVNFGSNDMRSRHTVNWDKTATDPRTGGKLKMVPSDAIASVRLGNWETGAEAEGITYTFLVDSAHSILLLKYACVMEDPQHSANEQPRFTLEILDENGTVIDPTCGFCNFAADSKRSGWHTYGSSYDAVTWKDWTTVGLNLDDYVGSTLTVRLATYDCSQSGHYGYAYFTLDCAGATIESASCGSSTQLNATAPSGFNYTWYYFDQNNDSVFISDQQDVSIATEDSCYYYCRLRSTETASCWFELSVLALPRFPMADGSWTYDPIDCKNRVLFKDKSYIQTRYYGDTINHYNERMAGYEWDFGDGSGEITTMQNCSHVFPITGGEFRVTLTTWIADGDDQCSDDTTFVLNLPELGDLYRATSDTICQGKTYTFGEKVYTEAGTYLWTHLSDAGCDIFDTLHLTIAPKHDITLSDTILCYGSPLIIGGTEYKPNSKGVAVNSFLNSFGCDSTVSIRVTEMPEMTTSVSVDQMEDAESKATVHVSGKNYLYYTINYGDTHYTDPSFETTVAGMYFLQFYDSIGCMVEDSADVIEPCHYDIYQRWNDVLSLKNYQQKHGVPDSLVASYQWYRNDTLIEGAQKTYYYAPELLVLGATYTCLITFLNGSSEFSCPFVVTSLPGASKVSVSPTYISGSQSVEVKVPEDAVCSVHNAMGMKVTDELLRAGTNTLNLNLPAGAYVLTIQTSERETPFRLMVK